MPGGDGARSGAPRTRGRRVRTAFIKGLEEVFRKDPSALLITGDLGFGVFDDIRAHYPKRVLNVGVAEQNMAGVAATLALSGHVVFTYSIANFPTIRCLEQIRNDICYHGANVKVVSVGGGMTYGALGPSHFATEDLALMGALPEMRVIAPGDPVECERLLPMIAAEQGPAYLRLGRAGEARIIPDSADIRWALPTELADPGEVLMLGAGGILPQAMAAADELRSAGFTVGLASVHTVRPFPRAWLLERLKGVRVVAACEEHSVEGGLGSAVAEVLAEEATPARLLRFGLPRAFPKGIGSRDFLLEANGLTVPRLVEQVLGLIEGGERRG